MNSTKISTKIYDTNPFIRQMSDAPQYKELIKNLDILDNFYEELLKKEPNEEITPAEYKILSDIVSSISFRQYPIKHKKNDTVRNSSIQFNIFNSDIYIRSAASEVRGILINNWEMEDSTISEILTKHLHKSISVNELLNAHYVIYEGKLLKIVTVEVMKQQVENIVNKIVKVQVAKNLINKYHDTYFKEDRESILKEIQDKITLLSDEQLLELKKTLQ